jgi:phosphoenolpyruvate synthase/pyruvate phosphate dikinase
MPEKIILSKIFSRERPFFYAFMWNDSDRLGYRLFLKYQVKNNLFLYDKENRKITVWYNLNELSKIQRKLEKQLSDHNTPFKKRLFKILESNWPIVLKYLENGIDSPSQFNNYYKHLVKWWSAMNLVFLAPNIKKIDNKTKKEFLSYRVLAERYTSKMNQVVMDFCSKIHRTKGIAAILTPKEIIKIAQKSLSSENINQIKKRLDGFGALNGKIYLQKNLDKKLLKNKITLENPDTKAASIKGNVAYPGKVKGRVRVVLSSKDFSLFKNNEILVTEMTDPNFISIFKKSLAVITDEGGITSHASITSRELKIPCIVGTKIATKSLRNGDLIEVDARKGIVRKL